MDDEFVQIVRLLHSCNKQTYINAIKKESWSSALGLAKYIHTAMLNINISIDFHYKGSTERGGMQLLGTRQSFSDL